MVGKDQQFAFYFLLPTVGMNIIKYGYLLRGRVMHFPPGTQGGSWKNICSSGEGHEKKKNYVNPTPYPPPLINFVMSLTGFYFVAF